MPVLSRKDSSFGPSSRSSLNSVSSAIFDRFRGFGSSSRNKALEERWRRPLTVRNVETFVEDQRIDDATSCKNRSMEVQIGFWLRTLPACEDDGIESTKRAMSKIIAEKSCTPPEDIPEGGSYSESMMAEG